MNPNYAERVREEIQKQLDAKFINPMNHYTWYHQLLNNKLRVCIDFLKLNEATIKDPFPIPFLEACWTKLQKRKSIPWWTALVVIAKSGYLQRLNYSQLSLLNGARSSVTSYHLGYAMEQALSNTSWWWPSMSIWTSSCGYSLMISQFVEVDWNTWRSWDSVLRGAERTESVSTQKNVYFLCHREKCWDTLSLRGDY